MKLHFSFLIKLRTITSCCVIRRSYLVTRATLNYRTGEKVTALRSKKVRVALVSVKKWQSCKKVWTPVNCERRRTIKLLFETVSRMQRKALKFPDNARRENLSPSPARMIIPF